MRSFPLRSSTRTWNFQGANFELFPNSGYSDLTRKSMGVFGNWNDEISSVELRNTELGITRVCVLHEHINWQGRTLTLFASQGSLVPFRSSGVSRRRSSTGRQTTLPLGDT